MMHSVIKGGWRPTFALAKQNDSDGRKSRIRRSKEERKALVESFIKKYQESNSGNFPSLNLTHKEVGGSFYTVREIVRDIIQENRVLGPAKFNLEEFNTEQFLEQNPLGSIARGPQPFLRASSNEDHPEHNEIPDTNGKLLSVSDRHYSEAEHQVIENGHVINVGHVDVSTKETNEATVVSDGCYTGADYPVVDNRHVVNGSQVDVTNKESIEAAVVSDGQYTGSEFEIVDKVHDVDASQVDVANKESIEAAVVSYEHCTGAELEIVDKEHDIDGSEVDVAIKESNGAAVPEMQVSKPTEPEQNIKQELAATTMPLAKVNALTKDLIVETFPLRSVAGTSNGIEGIGELRDSGSSLEKDEKFEIALGNKELKEVSNTEHYKEKNPGETLAETANHSTHKEHSSHEFKGSTDPQVRASHQKAITFETNNQSHIEEGAKTNIQAKKLSTTFTEGLAPSDEGLHEADKYRVDGLLSGNSHRRSNPTVDRINLESWDGRSKSSAKKEPNPLLALLKAFVNAIGKFLSE